MPDGGFGIGNYAEYVAWQIADAGFVYAMLILLILHYRSILLRHKNSLLCGLCAVTCRGRGRTGRRPRASKSGGNPKSETSKIKML